MENFLRNLSESNFKKVFPIRDILFDSMYYPACGNDFDLPFYYMPEYSSFIYVDYGMENFTLPNLTKTSTVIELERTVDLLELFPNGWQNALNNFPELIKINYNNYLKVRNRRFSERGDVWSFYKEKFIKWYILRTTKNNISIRWSLLYIGNDGIGTYYALYYSNEIYAKSIAIIQPGFSFGGNWTKFDEKDGFFANAVLKNPYGTPEMIVYGGYGDRYFLDWPYFEKSNEICPYYRLFGGFMNKKGCVTEWIKNK